MKYVNANNILPEKLIAEIQKYVQGETLYIPKPEKSFRKWGSRSGARKHIDDRNASIRKEFKNGKSISQLSADYFLSNETIKKIVYSQKH
jgi:Mor family transcriptional regulator